LNYKLLGAVVFSAVAVTLAFLVILGGHYSPEDKKSAWGVMTTVGAFWFGRATA
jgi:hypothetical protein